MSLIIILMQKDFSNIWPLVQEMANNENITFIELNKHKILENVNVIYIGGPHEKQYVVAPKGIYLCSC